MSKLSLNKESLQLLSAGQREDVAGATGYGLVCIVYKNSVWCASGLHDEADNCITAWGCPEGIN